MAINSFIFGGDTGETPDSIKRKRALAYALIQAQNTPRNVGEGIDALGKGLVAGILGRRADKAETAGIAKSNSAFDALINGGSSAPSTVPMSGAGNEVRASSPASSGVAAPAFANDGTELGALLSDPSKRSALPAGMRNNNPGNIKFVGQKIPGIVGPSVNTDQGDPQAVFATPEAGMNAMFQLAKKKYDGGKRTTNDLIAGNMGWTPGNYDAAANVARSMGLRPTDDLNLNDPQMAAKFLRGLIIQEHGKSGALYPEQMIMSAIGGASQQVASAQPMTATDAIAAQSPVPPVAPQAYQDPRMVNVGPQQPMPNAAAALAAPQGQAMAPQLPPPQNVSAPPPVAAVPQQAPQQVAQNTPAQALSRGPSIQQLMQVAQDPYLDEGKRSVVNALLQQKLKAQQDEQERIAKQSDPAYQTDLQLKQAQLREITSPTIKPADQARLDLEKQKLDFEQNGMSFADKEKLKLDREKFEAEQKNGQWEKMTDGRLYNKTTGEFRDAPPPLPGSTTLKPDDISGIRKEIQQLPSYKNLSQATPIYKSMVETADRNSKASDLNLVYGLGKIMDPTSVVREGEMVMVKNTASLPDWLVGAANALNGGATLQPETRQAILREAYGRMKGYSDEFGQQMGQYQGIAKRYNLNEDDIIPRFGEFKEWTPAVQSSDIGTDWKEISPGVRIRKVQ